MHLVLYRTTSFLGPDNCAAQAALQDYYFWGGGMHYPYALPIPKSTRPSSIMIP